MNGQEASSGTAAPLPLQLQQAYIAKHRLGDVVEHLSYAILRHKPSDHAAFARQWLANLRDKMASLQQDHICDGINLFTIEGHEAQTFHSAAAPAADVVRQRYASADIEDDIPQAHPKQHAILSSERAAEKFKRVAHCAVKGGGNAAAIEEIAKLADRLHKDDVQTAVAFLQNLLTRRAEKQKKDAEETRMLRKYRRQHALATADGGGGARHKRRNETTSMLAQPTSSDGGGGVRRGGDDGGVASTSVDNQPRRRIAISATPLNIDETTAPTFEIKDVAKSDEERKKLLECVEQCSLFTAFDEAQKELVVRAMEKQEFPAGFDILSQGQPGKETFFLVVSGMAEVIKDKRVVAPINTGQYFGELELMYNEASCAASIRTITPVTTYGLGKETYQHIVLNAALERRAMFLKLIETVGIFEPLIQYDKMRVAEALVIQQCSEKDVLIRCGEPVQHMYVIVEGVTRVVGRDPEGKLVDVIDLGAGEVVGELEFVFHHTAVADVVVLSTHCKVAKLNRKHFEMIIGSDVTDHMKQYIASKEIYRHYMAHAQEEVKIEIAGAQKRTARRRGTHRGGHSSVSHGGAVGSMHSGGAMLNNLLPDGEVFFDHSGHPCRFALQAITGGASRVMMIAVLEDGTVQRWNDAVVRVTQYRSDQAVGQSIFSFLTSELEQSKFHKMLRAAREWTGNWEGFVEAGLHKTQTFGFTQAESLSKVVLSLSVVPTVFSSSSSSSSDVFLAVGSEIKVKPPSSALDLGNWLREKMKPRLTALQKLLTDNELSVAGLKKVRGGVQLCERTLEQFVRIASTNIDSLQEGWRPVSMRVFMQRFLSAVSASTLRNGNRIVVDISEDFPLNDVFLDSEGMIKAMEVAVEDANTCGATGLDIIVRVEAVSHESSSAGGGSTDLMTSGSMANFARSMALDTAATHHPSAGVAAASSGSASMDTSPLGAAGTSNIMTSVNMSSTSPQSTSSGPKLIRITIEDFVPAPVKSPASSTAQTPQHAASAAPNEESSSVANLDSSEVLSGIAARGAHVADIRHYLSSMNGMVTFTSMQEQYHHAGNGAEYVLEVPLVVGEGNDHQMATSASTNPTNNKQHTFTTVLVERSAVHRNNVCQVLWSRRHAVLPVSSWSEVTKLVASGTCDILVIDPESLSDDISFTQQQEEDPFVALRSLGQELAIIVTSEEGACVFAQGNRSSSSKSPGEIEQFGDKEMLREDDGKTNSTGSSSSVFQLPKPWHMKTLVDTFCAAEALVVHRRDDEERIAALRNTFNETKRGNCEVVRLLGRGAFGEVHEVVDELTGGRMAMKRMRLKHEADVDALVEEIRTMTNLQHENIIHYFYCEKTSDSELKIFMELANGTLQEKIMATPGGCGLAHFEIVRHLKDLLQGLAYIHKHRYVHCDIKTANALLDSKERTKLGDFGAAKKVKEGDQIYVMCGTPMYMAPEVMAADLDAGLGYDFKADIWSLGCVVMEMTTGQPPFAHVEAAQGMGIFKYVSELHSTPDLSPLFHAGPLLISFVKACLDPNPSTRPSAEELLKFPLLTQDVSDATQQAEKLVKRAQLLNVLTKYVAFQDEHGNPPSRDEGRSPWDNDSPLGYFRGNNNNATESTSASFFDSEDDDYSAADSRIGLIRAKGGDFFSSDEDEEDGADALDVDSNDGE